MDMLTLTSFSTSLTLIVAMSLGQPTAMAQADGACQLSDEELIAETTWQNEDGVAYTEYFYESDRVAVLQGSELSSATAFQELRAKVAAKTETNAMVLLDRYFESLKSRDPDSPDVANARLVLEHQAGQVFQTSCAESLVLAKLLAAFASRTIEVNYYLFANEAKFRLYFALPNSAPAPRLTLRSKLAAKHLADGELEGYDFRVVGISQGFSFAAAFPPSASQYQGSVTGGELVPQHQQLPELKRLAEAFGAQIAMTNGFDTMSFDSYELSLMSCPTCQW